MRQIGHDGRWCIAGWPAAAAMTPRPRRLGRTGALGVPRRPSSSLIACWAGRSRRGSGPAGRRTRCRHRGAAAGGDRRPRLPHPRTRLNPTPGPRRGLGAWPPPLPRAWRAAPSRQRSPPLKEHPLQCWCAAAVPRRGARCGRGCRRGVWLGVCGVTLMEFRGSSRFRSE